MSLRFKGTKPSNAYGRRNQKKNLAAFAQDLQDSIKKALPSYGKPYGQVAVFAMHWENDQMGVAPLEKELLDIFRKTYHFYARSFEIPAQHSGGAYLALTEGLTKFSRDWAAPDALRIYVYSGHAESVDPSARQYHWAGRLNTHGRLAGPVVDWYRLAGVVEAACSASGESGGDILYIFDCCSSGVAATYDGPEVVAAATWDAIAGATLNTSFTRVLIDELKALGGAAQTVAGIFAAMFRKASQNQIDSPPVHILKSGADSITLAKLPGSPQKKAESFETRKRKGKFPLSENRVLISVQLQDDVTFPNIEQWKKWLTTNVPSGIFDVEITIESLFRGSGVVLVTVPLEVWTTLPANEDAYTFVAHVTSNNVLPNFSSSLPSTSTMPQQSHAPTGSENQPFSSQGKRQGGGHRPSYSLG